MLISGAVNATSDAYSYSPFQRADDQQSGTDARTGGNTGVASKDGSSGADGKKASKAGSKASSGTGNGDLDAQQVQDVEKLKKRDQEVRAHEQAHMAAGGQYVRGAASFTFEVGPDGHRYAVGGEVSIDMSAVPGDPAATVRKMAAVKAAALAPADPSGQDLSVAASADGAASKARREEMAQVLAAMQSSKNGTGKATGNNIDTVA